jgi:hypothetical protein
MHPLIGSGEREANVIGIVRAIEVPRTAQDAEARKSVD